MDLLNEEEIGALLYNEISKSRNPLSAAEFARKKGVREDIVHKLLRNLCDMKVAANVDGNKYIKVELAPGVPTHTFRESPIPPQPNMEVAVATGGAVNTSLVRQTTTQMVQSAADENERIKNEDAFQKILKYLAGFDGAVKSLQIAKDTGIGDSKTAVNPYLYFLEKQGVLSRDGTSFKLIKTVKEDEIKVMAAQRAKKPSGKKKTDSSSNKGECPCSNRGPGCVHNTFIQNNTHNHYNMQVGDNNTIYMDSDGPRRSDT